MNFESACVLGAAPRRLSIFILQNVSVLSHSDQELVDAHGGIYGNFSACRVKKNNQQVIQYVKKKQGLSKILASST